MSVEGRELAACPWCNGAPEIIEPKRLTPLVSIGCIGCGMAPFTEYLPREEAISVWNRRATPPDQVSGQSPIARDEAAGSALRDALGKLADSWGKELGDGDTQEERIAKRDTARDCAEQLRTLLAQPAAGTPTTNEGEK